MFKKLLASLVILGGLVFGQNPNTAVYPSSIATDTDLLVAANRAQTSLTAAIGAGDTTINVATTSAFLVPTAVTVGAEVIKVCSKTATSFTVCTSGRGFNSTTAVAHASGVAIAQNIVSYYFNQLAAEVKAIETNAANTTLSYSNPAWITSLAASKITGSVPLADAATALANNPTETGCTNITTVLSIDTGANITCSAITLAAADGTTLGLAAFTAADFNAALGVISLDYTNGQKATSLVPGFLTAADWTTFNAKQPAGNYITALTGDITATGPGSVAGTLAQCSACSASQVMITDASKNVGSLAYGTASSSLSLVERDSNSNAFANNFVSGMASIVSAGTTTNLSGGTARYLILTGTSTQTFRLPNATTLTNGARYELNNNSTGLLTITDLGGNTILTIPSLSAAYVILTNNGTTNGTWDFHYWLPATNIPQNTYNQTIQEEGSDLTQRSKLNFVGSTITCADDTTKTTCTLTPKNRQINLIVTGPTTTGVKACATVEVAYTIVGAHLIADALPTGANLVVDVTKVAFSSYTGTAAGTSITAAAIPTIATSDTNPRYSDTTLTGWTTSISADDVICVKINTAPTGGTSWAALTLEVQ